MNKNGFTTIELILTLAIVLTIMATITSVTYVYRDRSNVEEIKTDIINYKNYVTKIIYDDILNTNDRVIKMERDSENSNSFKLITANEEYFLNIIDGNDSDDLRVGINYNGVDYIVPGSTEEKQYAVFDNIVYNEDIVNNIYSLDIVFYEKRLDDYFKIHFVIS